jgi:hypothetical protein
MLIRTLIGGDLASITSARLSRNSSTTNFFDRTGPSASSFEESIATPLLLRDLKECLHQDFSSHRLSPVEQPRSSVLSDCESQIPSPGEPSQLPPIPSSDQPRQPPSLTAYPSPQSTLPTYKPPPSESGSMLAPAQKPMLHPAQPISSNISLSR